MDGPASQAIIPLSIATTIAIAISGTSQFRPKCAKKALNACITPAVRLICAEGTTHEITSAGRMKIASTSTIARKIDFGYSRPGFSHLVDVHRVHLHARSTRGSC